MDGRPDGIAFLDHVLKDREIERAFRDNAQFKVLTPQMRAALRTGLQEAMNAYELQSAYEVTPVPTAAQRELARVLKSLERVGSFGRSLSVDDKTSSARILAVAAMETAANRWADKQPLARLPSEFHVSRFESEGVSGIDYGSRGAIESFFAFAPVVYAFASDALKVLAERQAFGFKLSAIEWLVGSGLPLLYEQVTDDTFTVTIGADETTCSPGIRFVIDALDALGISAKFGGRFAPRTVRTHRRKAMKARQN